MTVKKLQKKAKLRNAEYFGLQEVLDRLYAQSAENKRFTVLMELVAADENILLAYRNISKTRAAKRRERTEKLSATCQSSQTQHSFTI